MRGEAAGPEPARMMRVVRSERPRSLWEDAWSRLIHDPRGLFGLLVVFFFTMVALVGPALAPHNPRTMDYEHKYTPPFWVAQSITGVPRNAEFPLGTDSSGRDVLSRTLYGTRISMLIGWLTVLLTLAIGLPVGLAAGYHGGRLDNALMRVTDVFYAFPTVMFYILIVMVLRETAFGKFTNGLVMLVFAFSAVGWVNVARLSRGSALAIRSAPFVDAAQSAGASTGRTVRHHVLPNIIGPVLVWVAAGLPAIITVEAILGYLKIGITPPTDPNSFFTLSWGGLVLDGRASLHGTPWVFVVPVVCLALLSIGFTFLSDSLRDALDPRAE